MCSFWSLPSTSRIMRPDTTSLEKISIHTVRLTTRYMPRYHRYKVENPTGSCRSSQHMINTGHDWRVYMSHTHFTNFHCEVFTKKPWRLTLREAVFPSSQDVPPSMMTRPNCVQTGKAVATWKCPQPHGSSVSRLSHQWSTPLEFSEALN